MLIGVLIALGLLLAPVQAAAVSLASQTMQMGSETCPEKPSCCDLSKSTRACTDATVCFAKCGGAAGFAHQAGIAYLSVTVAVIKSPSALALLPFAPPPLRRPPRI
jgi:hypothetical protein